MAFELDPLFHNKTMVKILLAQGHLLHAGKICQKLLARDSENESLKELYEKTRTNFMKNFAGVAAKAAEEVLEEEEEITEPGLRKERLEAALAAKEEQEKAETRVEAEVQEELKSKSEGIAETKTSAAEVVKMSLSDKVFNLEFLLLKVQERRL
ncbi:MAG: hypothetical protein HQM15_03335 [Deltaproteobacteria bacterium]|nr:hypothetical protein [Deltaproteobacteria bacterium]